MLAQILQDMWVEPEVLEALSEEQKRILFLKMREEQVRRWKEREEKEERERGHNRNTKSKKASSKHVRWLLGRDGDVSVSIIGEVDELRSSRLLQNLMNNRFQSDNMNAIQRVDLLPGSEDQQLNLKEDIQLPVTHDDTASPNDQSSEEDMDSCSADDDPKDMAEDSDSESGSGSDNLSDWTPLYKPHFSSHGNQPLRAPLADTEKTGPQDRETACYKEKPEGRGHVEQLRKKFTDNHHNTSTASKKPPIPAKPAHLQK
ncbi:SH2 domain-containing protein 4A [Neolamprologus brichardi]|uniref:SH2 domain-containing protein 4A n=1 Tax=Neolamprologus brichardi TaxID=32507 RepID=UPI0003EC3C14|nr:SH2 domain-containing protein 4A [Neolamprologus brichardi]XP_006781903.1 SH2 domain-containing protein 4A [Neolamprologus brichardi]